MHKPPLPTYQPHGTCSEDDPISDLFGDDAEQSTDDVVAVDSGDGTSGTVVEPSAVEFFTVLVADPPWGFGDKLRQTAVKRGAEANYPTLTIERIAALPVQTVMADSAVCCLWTPAAFLAEGLGVLKSWGFTHKQVWVWIKTTKKRRVLEDGTPHLAFGMGRLARNASEYILVGVRGDKPGDLYGQVQDHSIRNVFFAPATPHSVKPECVQDALYRMFPSAPKLEMFARRQRPGWTCIGNEAPDTEGRDIRDSLRDLAGKVGAGTTSSG